MAKVDSSTLVERARSSSPMKPQVRGYLWATLIILLLPLLHPCRSSPGAALDRRSASSWPPSWRAGMAMSAAVCALLCLADWPASPTLPGDCLVLGPAKPEEWQAFAEARGRGVPAEHVAKAPLLGLWLSGLTGLTLGGSAEHVYLQQLRGRCSSAPC